MTRRNNVYRNGRVHVAARLCPTCIFRPGDLMQLREGRVEQMVAEAGEDGCIPCHRHRNQLLQIAARLGAVTFVQPEEPTLSTDTSNAEVERPSRTRLNDLDLARDRALFRLDRGDTPGALASLVGDLRRWQLNSPANAELLDQLGELYVHRHGDVATMRRLIEALR